MGSDIQAAYGSIFNQIGIFLSAIALANWIADLFEFPLGVLLQLLSDTLGWLVYWLVNLLKVAFNVVLPAFFEHAATVYSLVGAAASRTWVHFLRISRDAALAEGIQEGGDVPTKANIYLTMVIGALVWPYMLSLDKPVVARRGQIMRWIKGGPPIGFFDGEAASKMVREGRYVCDLRKVMLYQLLLVLLESAGMLSVDSVMSGGDWGDPFVRALQGI